MEDQQAPQQERTETEVSGADAAMHEQKITLILLHKLAGREPVTITADDLAKIADDFAGGMPVLYAREVDGGNLVYQVIDAREVEAIERQVKQDNARRVVESLAATSQTCGIVSVNAAQTVIQRAGGSWPGAVL